MIHTVLYAWVVCILNSARPIYLELHCISTMIFNSVFFSGLFLLFDQTSAKCGMKLHRRFKVLNGQSGIHQRFPWAVAFVQMWGGKPGFVTCSGTLISKRHIVTAAHCLYDSGNRQSPLKHVVFGDDINRPLAVLTERYRYIHPKYDPFKSASASVINDIAIIELKTKVSSRVGMPICLTHWKTLSKRYPHTGYGFGLTPYENRKLRFYKTKYVDEGYGHLWVYAYLPKYGMQYPVHVCKGDSGGGLSFTTKTGEEILMGITSTGPVYNCNAQGRTNYRLWRGSGAAYSDVRYHYRFICKYAKVGC